MKKGAALLLAAAFIFAAPGAGCAGDDYDYLVTDGLVNGMGFIDKNKIVVGDTECYAYGCMDALFIVHNEQMCKLYPHTTQKDILQAVKRYYNDNPLARSAEPIVQVLLAGCKPTQTDGKAPPPDPYQYDPYICRK